MKAKGDIEILLADDERAFRSGMKALLESEGFAVRTARDGEAAARWRRHIEARKGTARKWVR